MGAIRLGAGRERGVVIKALYCTYVMNIQVRRSNKEVQLCYLGKLDIVTCGWKCNKQPSAPNLLRANTNASMLVGHQKPTA